MDAKIFVKVPVCEGTKLSFVQATQNPGDNPWGYASNYSLYLLFQNFILNVSHHAAAV
jgi:hypothetical protein